MSDQNNWEFSFTWRIADFIPCNHMTGEELKSPTFSVEALKNSMWYLSIYPCGRNESCKGYVSVFLNKSKDNAVVEVGDISYRIEVLLDGDILQFVNYTKITIEDGKGWGTPTYIERDKLLSEMKKSNSNILTLQCYIKNCNEIKRPIEKSEAQSLMLTDKASFVWKVKFFDSSSVENRRYFCLNDTLYKITIAITQNHVTITVHKICESFSISPQITGKISILNIQGNESLSKEASHSFSTKTQIESWEFPEFISEKQMLDNSYEGTITLSCEFFIYNASESKILSNENRIVLSDIDSLSNLSLDFRNLFIDKNNHDVKLRVDQVELKAHRCVLAARSPVFSAMFDQEMIENRTGVINIEDVDASILESFLQFLYTGVVDDMDSDTAIKLLVAADKYEVLFLKQMCAVFLMSALSLDNACEILTLADMVCNESLKKCALEFIAKHAAEIFSSLELKNWIKSNPNLSAEMMAYLGKNFKFIPSIS